VTTSSCGGGGYGYTESVELENVEISEDGKFPNGTAIPMYSGEPLGDGHYCTSAKHCCSGRCINHKCCAAGKKAVGLKCAKPSACCSNNCALSTLAGVTYRRCCPRGTLAPGATCNTATASFCCQGSCSGANTCCLSPGARVDICTAVVGRPPGSTSGTNLLCCTGECDDVTMLCT